ncbi:MAG: signal recognition particle receptor subunit alpha, partial [Clostridia bacterium]|nr:signal recognition particle receptor subunit alpha [Clostridia bacterium]
MAMFNWFNKGDKDKAKDKKEKKNKKAKGFGLGDYNPEELSEETQEELPSEGDYEFSEEELEEIARQAVEEPAEQPAKKSWFGHEAKSAPEPSEKVSPKLESQTAPKVSAKTEEAKPSVSHAAEPILEATQDDEAQISDETQDKPTKEKGPGFFARLKDGLKKTRDSITHRIDQVLVSFGKIDEELFEELEEILITSDMGMETSLKVIAELREKVKKDKITDTRGVRQAVSYT